MFNRIVTKRGIINGAIPTITRVIWSCVFGTKLMQKRDPSDLSVISSGAGPSTAGGFLFGAGGDADNLYASEYNTINKVFRLDPANFSIIQSVTFNPIPSSSAPGDLGGNADVLFIADWGADKAHELSTTTLTVIRTSNGPGAYLRSVAGTEDHVWFASQTINDRVGRLDYVDLATIISSAIVSNLWGAGGGDDKLYTTYNLTTVQERSISDYSVIKSLNDGTNPLGIGGK